MLSQLDSIKELPKVIEQSVATRRQLWKERHHSDEICDQVKSEGKQFLSAKSGHFPKQCEIVYDQERVANELAQYDELALKINTAQAVVEYNRAKISSLKSQIATLEQQIATRKKIWKIIFAVIGVIALVGILVVVL